MAYAYPLDMNWSKEEMTAVVEFFHAVELAYEGGVDRTNLLAAYRAFKEVVPSKMEEKQLGNAFEKVSSYSVYRTMQKARAVESGRVTMP
ncbi:UPF0223 family protein [Aerococcus sp. UMB7834]|nr:UPF0223 family protein [Aerococcus sp. UMB7834]MDK6805506.1 UPF0223 family protein [Aerococcus sp. UMB7834]